MSIDRARPLLSAPPIQVGTWAGNLMLTHSNDNFPSDVYTIMEAVGAKVTIATSATDSKSYSLQDFLSVAMTTSVIVSMEIPFLTTNEQFKSFKVMPRAQVRGMCRYRVDRHRSHACTYIRTCMHRCIPVCTHTRTHTHGRTNAYSPGILDKLLCLCVTMTVCRLCSCSLSTYLPTYLCRMLMPT